MREFILLARRAVTRPFKLNDLPGSAGRMDLVCRCISSALWISNDLRRDTSIHVVLCGPPSPPRIITFYGKSLKGVNPDERNIASHINKALKVGISLKLGETVEVSPGIEISKKSFESLVKEKMKDSQMFYSHPKGKDVREIEFEKDTCFIVGDYIGLPRKTESLLKRLRIKKISVGPLVYFASHVIVIINNELDRRFFYSKMKNVT